MSAMDIDPTSKNSRSPEAVCRICLAPGGPVEALEKFGCRCRGSLGLVHQQCAVRWLMPRARGKAEGLACEMKWKLSWTVQCEICKANVNEGLTHLVIQECTHKLRRAQDHLPETSDDADHRARMQNNEPYTIPTDMPAPCPIRYNDNFQPSGQSGPLQLPPHRQPSTSRYRGVDIRSANGAPAASSLGRPTTRAATNSRRRISTSSLPSIFG